MQASWVQKFSFIHVYTLISYSCVWHGARTPWILVSEWLYEMTQLGHLSCIEFDIYLTLESERWRRWAHREIVCLVAQGASQKGSYQIGRTKSHPELLLVLRAGERRAGHCWDSLCLHFFSVNFCISFPLVSFPLMEAGLHISGDTTPKAYHKPSQFLRVFECCRSNFTRFRIT